MIRWTLLAIALAQPTTAMEGPMDQLLGEWHGVGTLHGRAVAAELQWDRVLGNRFYRVSYTVSAEGETVFEGRGFYDVESLEGTWFDSFGHTFAIEGELSSAGLRAEWGAEGIESGTTEYRLGKEGILAVVDSVVREGQPQQFARIEYRRAE